jgi:hypothetical protein
MNADGSWQVGTAAWSAFSETVANPYRPGLSPQEIQIDDTDGMATSFSTFLPKATVQTPSGSISRKTSWNSWRQIAQIGANNGTAFDDIANWSNTDANKYLTTYFPYSYDVEAYRTSPTGTDYHRLDLWAVDWDGTTWDATTLADLHSSTADFWNANGTINTVYNPSASPPVSDVSAAAALNGFTDANVTLQTLLNLVDFCDTDSVATHLPAGSVWTTTPTQVGNEVQPYINEIGFAASYVYDDPDGTSGSGDETGYLNLTVLLEVAEIYGSTKPINAEVRFDLDQDGTITNETLTITGLASANDYTVVTDNIATIELTVAPVPTTVNVEISNLRVALTDATGGLADWSTALNSNLTAALVGDSMTYDIWYASTQVEDPRCNTSTSDWTTTNFVNGNPNTLTMGTLTVTGGGNAAIVLSAPGGVNTISGSPVDPSNPTTNNGACDNETVTDPVLGLSTAYIANRADITFWELGAVHRGEPWRTINLHNYTSAAGYRDYTAGDGLLLDQIKLGSFAEMVGRVNVNSPYDEVWKGVLYGIRVGQSYGDVHDSAKLGGTGTPTGAQLTTTELTGLSAGITTQIANGTPALDRGAIAAVPELSAGSGTFAPTTDRSQEELIGKIANLLTARQNIFTILVTAQSVRDVSTNGNAGGDFVEYNPSPKKYFRVLTEQRVLATVYRDAFTNRFRIARMEYLED